MTLYEDIGEAFIEKTVREFYSRAVIDPLISHFFFNIDVETLIKKQVEFTKRLLGARNLDSPHSRSLKQVHAPLGIRSTHFARRQKLMEEVLNDLKLDQKLSKEWLKRESSLRALIVSQERKFCIE